MSDPTSSSPPPDQQQGGIRTVIDPRLSTLVPDRGEQPYTAPSDLVATAAVSEIQAASQEFSPQNNPSAGGWGALTDGLSGFWDSSARNWVLGAVGIVVAALIIASAHSGGGSSQTTLPPTLTPTQALQAQQLVERQLASADQTLKKVGVSAEAIDEAHHQVEIVDGTQLLQAIRPLDGSVAMPKRVTVSGSTAPNHYASLAQVDGQRYATTLSPNPALSDLTNNSAVIHNLSSNDQ